VVAAHRRGTLAHPLTEWRRQIRGGHQRHLHRRARLHHTGRNRVAVAYAESVDHRGDLGRGCGIGLRRHPTGEHPLPRVGLIVPVLDELEHRPIVGTAAARLGHRLRQLPHHNMGALQQGRHQQCAVRPPPRCREMAVLHRDDSSSYLVGRGRPVKTTTANRDVPGDASAISTVKCASSPAAYVISSRYGWLRPAGAPHLHAAAPLPLGTETGRGLEDGVDVVSRPQQRRKVAAPVCIACVAACQTLNVPVGPTDNLPEIMVGHKGSIGGALAHEFIWRHPYAAGARWLAPLEQLVGLLRTALAPATGEAGTR